MKSDRSLTLRESYLPFSPPSVGEEEIEEVVDTLRSGWISTGPKTRSFEAELAAYLGAPTVLALNSCTAGLHIALVTGGIGPGDEVITSAYTFAATVNVIEHVGAQPVLVDVEPDTLNLDPALVESAVTSRTRAIIPVHFAGHPAELDPLRQLAQRHDLVLVEDAAHAMFARYKGDLIGSGDNPVAFSFYATKNLTTGEGGALSGEPSFLEKARVVSLHGMDRTAWTRAAGNRDWFYEVTVPGFKYNMTDIQAALGLTQLHKATGFQQRRRQVVDAYNSAFAAYPELQVPVERPHVEHAWHLYTLRLAPGELRIDRDEFVRQLDQRRIGTSVHFIPVHLHPYYADKYSFRPADFPVAVDNFERILSLPLHPSLSDADVQDVIGGVVDVVEKFGR